MAEVVLDASAILAMLRAEPGSEHVENVIDRSIVCVINDAEVISKLISRGQTPQKALEVVRALPYRLADLDSALARHAAMLWPLTKAAGLSLADRCCLALAAKERIPALTADQAWGRVSVGVHVRLLPGRRGD